MGEEIRNVKLALSTRAYQALTQFIQKPEEALSYEAKRRLAAAKRRLAEDDAVVTSHLIMIWSVTLTFHLAVYLIGCYIEKAKRDAMQRGREWHFEFCDL